MRIERRDVIAYGTPLLFVGTALLAGSKRLIKHFPGASQKGLFCSAAFGSVGVIVSGLKNSEDDDDYNRRVYTIAGLALTAIAAPTMAKILIGRVDLNFKASLRFAFIQGLVFGAVDFSSSFMETDTPPPIPEPQKQAPIDSIPIEVLPSIFQYLERADIPNIALTCKNFQAGVETSQIQRCLAEQFAFGPKDWNRYFGDVGEVPPLPHDIVDILKAPCPYWVVRNVGDTHLLVLIPRTINGRLFTLGLLGEMIKSPKGGGYPTKYDNYDTAGLNELKDHGISKSYWALITWDVLPESLNKIYDEQRSLVREAYEIPMALEIATGILMHHVSSGEMLYPDSPNTCTRCQEKVCGDNRVLVGSFGSSGLQVGDYFGDDFRLDSDGLCGVRKF